MSAAAAGQRRHHDLGRLVVGADVDVDRAPRRRPPAAPPPAATRRTRSGSPARRARRPRSPAASRTAPGWPLRRSSRPARSGSRTQASAISASARSRRGWRSHHPPQRVWERPASIARPVRERARRDAEQHARIARVTVRRCTPWRSAGSLQPFSARVRADERSDGTGAPRAPPRGPIRPSGNRAPGCGGRLRGLPASPVLVRHAVDESIQSRGRRARAAKDERVGVPHLACRELVAAPHGGRHGRDEVDDSSREPRVGSQ